jgi:threonine dehydratase
MAHSLIEQDDILAARKVIAGRVHRIPVIGSSYLGAQAGVQLYFKLELFQKTGSFKPRGVLSKRRVRCSRELWEFC